jgi:hypothetical protein
MESDAKILKICDNCKTPLKAGDPDRDLRITATLANEKGANQTFHMCNEKCLLAFLQKRAKKTIKAFLFDIKTDFRRY